MARYAAWVGFVVTVVLVVGCEPVKELPTDVPKVDRAPTLPQVTPNKSEPAAKAIVDRAVLALTGGKPELLAKGKVSRANLKGVRFTRDTATQWTEVNRTVAAVWPDRVYAAEDFQAQNNKVVIEGWLRRPEMIVFNNGVPHPHANPTEREQNFASDEVGQHWMALLIPATDPKAVLFDSQSVESDRRMLRLVKLALGAYPTYHLTFDGKTDALLRVEYAVTEFGSPRLTTMIYSDHKPGPEGLVLPYKFECLHNGVAVERLTVEKWELPAAIKDEEFSPPKK